MPSARQADPGHAGGFQKWLRFLRGFSPALSTGQGSSRARTRAKIDRRLSRRQDQARMHGWLMTLLMIANLISSGYSETYRSIIAIPSGCQLFNLEIGLSLILQVDH